MKKLMMMAAAAAVAFGAWADEETVGGYTWTYQINGDTAEIYGSSEDYYNAASGESHTIITPSISPYPTGALAIPSTLGGKPVTCIRDYAFYRCSGLTSVTIPDSVTSIGYSAFSGCSASLYDTNSIPGVKLVDGWAVGETGSLSGDLDLTGIRGIGAYAFSGCSGLTSVTIPDSVTSVGFFAFYGCSGLTSVTIPSRWKMSDVFPSAYTTLESIAIPPGSCRIVVGAFKGCTSLTSVSVPDTVTSIGDEAFYNCSSLQQLTIPDSVTSIGGYAFYGTPFYDNQPDGLVVFCKVVYKMKGDCPAVVTIPAGVTGIGDYAFSGCSGLTSVSIPDSVTSIGGSAFSGCSGLTSVTIPSSVTSIGDSAFSGCSGLTGVTIPDSVTSIGYEAFSGCSGLKDAVLPSRWALSSLFPASYSSITNVTVPSGSSGIANSAFKGCRALTSINIPDTVTSIGDEAFYNCTSLEHLTIPEGVTSYGVNCFEGCPAYTLQLYRSVFGGGSGGGSPSVSTTIVQQVEMPYALTNSVADRAIASVTVDGDCAIDAFVLKDGKVYDTVLYISNTADHAVTLTLPSGYVYKAIKGARPLSIPANSQSILSITRVAADVFLVSREDLETIQ